MSEPANQVKHGNYGFVGTSSAMATVYDKIACVAKSAAPVFIQGETGTGKELCAEAIHKAGPRANKPFVALNCGAIPHDLMESELFGHLKGAFTGAIETRKGAARMADGGTLFLDEICELPLAMQTKLLRFLQSGLVQTVGACKAEKVDVRIICATNKSPQAEMKAGSLRPDLYYRLFVLPIKLPPLRLRGADIYLIAEHFLARLNKIEDKNFTGFSQEALVLLETHDWPGNVRELQNVVRQAVVLHDAHEVTAPMLSGIDDVYAKVPDLDVSAFTGPGAVTAPAHRFRDRQLWQIERDAIEAAIVAADGSIPRAAQKLGVSPSTIYRKRENWRA